MRETDHLTLDGHALQLFLAVIEAGSVTAAADRLDLTQSAVSHALERLRRIVRDPLFVRSGRGIVPTAHALALASKAQAILDSMQDFSRATHFVPAEAKLSLTIAANDLQRDLLLPDFFRHVGGQVAHLDIRIIPSGVPSPEVLREGRCDLLISPFPPVGTDIMQKRLIQDHYICYYDADARAAPASLEDYCAARHVTVVYTDNDRLNFDKVLEGLGVRRDIAVSVPNFSGVPTFLRGTDMLASMPSLLEQNMMAGFASVPLPIIANSPKAYGELPMFMAWHVRNQQDPQHIWLRSMLVEVTDAIAGATPAGKPQTRARK